jgi:hypothetical protein
VTIQTMQPTKSLREIAEEIAKALGQGWIRSTKFDDDDAAERTQWRARLDGSGVEALFLSNTWGPKGMIHVAGWVPDSIDRQTVRIPQMASINISLTKTPQQMARDIERRLLPDYRKQLAEVLKAHIADLDWKEEVRKTKHRVTEIIGGLAMAHSEIVNGRGSVDIQVCGPDSLRFHGHCLYFTVEQLDRIRKAVPELFERNS